MSLSLLRQRFARHAIRARLRHRPGVQAWTYHPHIELFEDRRLLAFVWTVTSAFGGFGGGTLADAITLHNQYRTQLRILHQQDAQPDRITFNIRPAGAQTIRLEAPFDDIQENVIIDGTTQPGYAGRPLIELSGENLGANGDGLRLVGGDASGPAQIVVQGLVINRFKHDGIFVNSSGNTIQRNYIGTDASGTRALANGTGVELAIAARNLVSSNLISGNTTIGVKLLSAANNQVAGNSLGTDITGTRALPNGTGVQISGNAISNLIGGGNLISGNQQDGVDISTIGTSFNQVVGNFIGTDGSGTRPLGNGRDGVRISYGAHHNAVGRCDPVAQPCALVGPGNVISANGNDGVAIFLSTYQNVVQGNLIGTTSTGNQALGNRAAGVHIYEGAFRNLVGGTQAVERNIISANGTGVSIENNSVYIAPPPPGVDLYPGKSPSGGNFVQGNYIGTDVSGTARLGNGTGVFLGNASRNYIGTTGFNLAPGWRNLISANTGNGVVIVGNQGGNNLVQDNRIGTDVNGTNPLGNLQAGALVNAGNNTLALNVIAANATDGIRIDGAGARNILISGNVIGLGTNNAALPNRANGIHVTGGASNNSIGGTVNGFSTSQLANTIADNTNDGVLLESGDGNLVSGNGIFFNGHLGIELRNDANQRTQAPVLDIVYWGGDHSTVSGHIQHGVPRGHYAIEIFASPPGEPSGVWEGRNLLGTIYVENGDEGAIFWGTFPAVPFNWTFTATATDPARNTSAFSNPVAGVAEAAARFEVTGFPARTTAGAAGSVTVTVRDAFGGLARNYRGTVHFTSTDRQAGLPADYLFSAADGGVHVFNVTLRTAGQQTLTVTDTVTAAITGSQTGIAVVPAAASTLVVSGFPSPTTAGVPGNFTVTARDPYGNVATSYRGTVHFTSTDRQAGLPSDYPYTPADNGVHVFNATLKTAGPQTLTATDTVTAGITGSQAGITITPAAASILAVAGFPSPTTAGVAGNLTITAQDPFGNTATGYRGTATFSSSDAQATLPVTYTFTAGDNGVHTFSVTLATAGPQALTATDTVQPNIHGTQANITVGPAALDHFQLDAPDDTTAGTSFDVTVTARDAYGNIVVSYTGPVTFSSTDPAATLPSDYSFRDMDHGVHVFPASSQLVTAGNQTITVTDVDGLFAGSAGVSVSPAGLSQFRWYVDGAATSGEAFGVTVEADDFYGNVQTDYRGTVHFTTSDPDPGVVLPPDYTFTDDDNGVHSFPDAFILITVGDQTLTVTDILTGTEGDAVVTVNPPAGVPGSNHPSGTQTTTPAAALSSALSAAWVEQYFAATHAEEMGRQGNQETRRQGEAQREVWHRSQLDLVDGLDAVLTDILFQR